jgi:hypothetical protein
MFNRTTSLTASLLFLVLLLTACGPMTLNTKPDAYPFPSDAVIDLRPGTSVRISNFYAAEELVKVHRTANIDLEQFTDTAVLMVQRELTNNGLLMSSTGERTIVLRMINPLWERGMWTQTGHVTLQAELGNGETLSFDGESQTGGNAFRMFNGATLRAVTALLTDSTIAAYLNQ